MALLGNEILQVQGLDLNGYPAATTEQTTTGAVAQLSGANPKAYVAVGGTATAVIGGKYLLNTATGSVLALPTAMGTGGTVEVVTSVTVTSNAHKVLAGRSTDYLQGVIFTEDSGTATGWYAAPVSTFCSLQINGSTTGGFLGDSYTLKDIAANTWQVTGSTKSTGTAATPFSTATT